MLPRPTVRVLRGDGTQLGPVDSWWFGRRTRGEGVESDGAGMVLVLCFKPAVIAFHTDQILHHVRYSSCIELADL